MIRVVISGIYIFIFCAFNIIGNKSVQRYRVGKSPGTYSISAFGGTVPEVIFFFLRRKVRQKEKCSGRSSTGKWISPGFVQFVESSSDALGHG